MHSISISDFDELFNSGLKKLVIGSGDKGNVELYFGKELDRELKNREIELIMMNTHDLVNYLNGIEKRDFLVLVHVIC